MQTTVSHCYARSEQTMFNWYSFINVSKVNLSQNTAQNSISAIYCSPSQTNTADSNGIGTSITYSSFADNTVTSDSYCIYQISLLDL